MSKTSNIYILNIFLKRYCAVWVKIEIYSQIFRHNIETQFNEVKNKTLGEVNKFQEFSKDIRAI